MDGYIDPVKVAALTPDNLLAIFKALLLVEISIDHFGEHLSVEGREFVEPLGDGIGIGDVLESDFGRSHSRQRANVGFGCAA